MKNSTKFKILRTHAGIALLQRVGGGFTAYAEDVCGAVGDIVEVAEKDYTPEGDLAAYQKMSDRFDEAA